MKKIISLVLALLMLSVNTAVGADGEYVASDWAKEELIKAESMGLISESLFDKDLREDITRAEFAAVSVKLYEVMSQTKINEVSENPFSDTSDAEVLKAYSLGITLGTSANAFSPEELLSREEAATMLTRAYKKATILGWTIENDTEAKLEYNILEKFADDEDISDWARDSVYFMASKSIINGVGDNKFAPKNVSDEQAVSGYANATREQAIIIAVRMADVVLQKFDPNNPDPYGKQNQNPIKSDDENTYTIAFIGGSLTEGGATWINATKEVVQKSMPDKTVVTINAGKGGTQSSYGAPRFMEDVGKYAPDMVFIEFAVNDSGDTSKIPYIESMIYQCLKLPKKPVVILLQTPFPTEIGSTTHTSWLRGVELREELAKYYGIKSINIYDYMQEDYNNVKEEQGYETFTDYLSKYYTKTGTGFNVHGGYYKYAEAIVKAFNEDYEGCMKIPENKSIYLYDKRIVTATYKYIPAISPTVYYSGKWNNYTAKNPFTTADSKISINEKQFEYPFFSNGIKQTTKRASFGFETTAEAFCLNYPAATAGSTAKVYIDGKESGTINCYSTDHSLNVISEFISLPNDGNVHKVILVTNEPTANNYVFRFGYIVERYAN